MSSIEQQLQALTERLQRTEDELAIRNLITRYGLAVDCGDTAAALACHSEQARYIVSAPRSGRDEQGADDDLVMSGHAAIHDMLESELHQSLLPNCAHTVGPVTVEIAGNTARATGYSRLFHRQGDDFKLMRLAINEWQLEKTDSRWLICSRESRLVGEESAKQLLLSSAFNPRG